MYVSLSLGYAYVLFVCLVSKLTFSERGKYVSFFEIMFYLYSVPGVTFSSNFLHAVTFLHVLHLDVIKRQIEIETESKN